MAENREAEPQALETENQGVANQGTANRGTANRGAANRETRNKPLYIKKNKRGIQWLNQNRIKEFKYNSKVGENTVNSSRPLVINTNHRVPPKLRANNNNNRRNIPWKTAKSIMKDHNQGENRRALSKGEFNAVVQGYYNEKEAEQSQMNFLNPAIPKTEMSPYTFWYHNTRVTTPKKPVVATPSRSFWPSSLFKWTRSTAGGTRRNRKTRRKNIKG
jgi:hypothetical protein